MEVDINQLFSTLFAGGALYAAIRLDIRHLWKNIDRLDKRIDKVEKN